MLAFALTDSTSLASSVIDTLPEVDVTVQQEHAPSAFKHSFLVSIQSLTSLIQT